MKIKRFQSKLVRWMINCEIITLNLYFKHKEIESRTVEIRH